MYKKDISQDNDDDWRSQIDSLYSGSEYNDLLSLSSKINRSPDDINTFSFSDTTDGSKRKVFDAIRFPPVPIVPIPEEIYKRDYEQDFELRSSFCKHSSEDDESMAALDFMENMLLTVVEKAVDIRSSIIENGNYIYSLSRTPTSEEIEYMKTIIMENLITLHEESMTLITEIDAFQADNIDDMLYSESVTNNIIIQKLKISLQERANYIKNAIVESTLIIDGLSHYSNSIICLPAEKICKLDGIYIDWSIPHKLEDNIHSSNRSLNYADFMRSYGFPICGQIYCYLQSTISHANILAITDYSFKIGELKCILNFFDIQAEKSLNRLAGIDFISVYQSIHTLVMNNCHLSDQDCHLLTTKLYQFTNLSTLNLSNNCITYSGVASIASVLFEYGSNLRCIRLDNNLIRSDGALFIAQVLHKLPYLEILSLSGNPIRDKGLYFLLKYSLNPLRSTTRKLYKPHNRWTASVDGSNLNDEEGSDDEEDTVNTMGESSNSIVDDIKVELTPQQRFLKQKIQRQCYYDDYFYNHYSIPGITERVEKDKSDEKAYNIAQIEKAQWFNREEDEFYLDGKSEYSDTEDEEDATPDLTRLGLSVPLRGSAASVTASVSTLPTEAELGAATAKRYKAYGKCTKLIQWMMKIRVKLVAVNAFTRMLRTGGVLTSLSVARCKLTSDIVPTIVQALIDNKNILSLDVSYNPELLGTVSACQVMGTLLEKGGLVNVLLNNCGINDRGFMELTRGASCSRSVRTLELSNNKIGPTGANWTATANKVFFLDALSISGGYHASAPFKKIGDPSLSSVFDDELATVTGDSIRNGSDEGKAQQVEDYLSDGIASYEDTDLFDGEDDDASYEDYLDELDDSEADLSATELDHSEEEGEVWDEEQDRGEREKDTHMTSTGASNVSRGSRDSIMSVAVRGVSGFVKRGLATGSTNVETVAAGESKTKH